MTAVATAIAGSAILGYAASSSAADASAEATAQQGQIANQQAQVSREQLGLAREQWTAGQARQEQFDPIYMRLLQSAEDDATTARDRGATQWQQYTDTFQPLEQKLASTAANYDTAGRRDAAAADARAGVQTQFDAQVQQQQRGLSRAGIALDSGRALTLQQSAGLNAAKAMAGADRAARTQVEDRGIQLTDNAARFGRNQTGTALQASGQGTGATQAASGIGATGAGVYQAALNPALSLYGQSSATAGQAGAMFGNQAQTQASAAGAAASGIGQAAMMGGLMFAKSSKKLKTDKRPLKGLNVTDARVLRDAPATRGLNQTPVERWKYKKGVADEGEHVGPYAEDVRKQFGDEVAPGGAGLRMDRMAEVNQRAVGELTAKVAQLEREIADLEGSA